MNTSTYQRLCSNINNKIAAKKTIVIASVNLLNVTGPIRKKLCRWQFIKPIRRESEVEVLVSLVDDSLKPKDPMPKYFRDMERHGLKITSWDERV